MATPLILGDTSLVSVITASHLPHAPWLEQAYGSLLAQRLSNQLRWEWLLQLDGADELLERVPSAIRDDERVRIEVNGASLGAAAARNYALTRSRGAFVRNLDADDWLLDGALEHGAEILAAGPELAFVFTGALICENSAVPEPHPIRIPHSPGRLEAGALDEYWRVGGDLGLFATAVTFNRTHLLAYGGWAGLRRFEDCGLMFPLACEHPTFYDPRPSVVYRLHEQQTVRTAGEQHIRTANRSYTAQRVAAQHALRGVVDTAPQPRPIASYADRIAEAMRRR